MVALGLAHAHFSAAFAGNARLADPASPAPDFEQAIELTYAIKLSDRFKLQPDLQYIRHPSGCTAVSDALAFLVRLNASY